MGKIQLRGEVIKGDPADHVLGKPEEQPARNHAPLPKRERVVNDHSILHDIRQRMDTLAPAVQEYRRLERIVVAFDDDTEGHL